jgi:4-diphosphocytidyl-2-C-methyl-D-erythritol kinase
MVAPVATRTPSAGGLAAPFTWAGPNAVVAACPAKLNLFLEVIGKRPDGYHAIETLILAVDLFDTLELRVAAPGRSSLECVPTGLPTGPDNLVTKATSAFQSRFGSSPTGLAARVTKRIPTEAGLGGGSSDAAAALESFNRLGRFGRDQNDLSAAAADCGSDVGFFLAPPAAWCTGRGEIVQPVSVGGTFHFVVVKPAVGCPTAEVYKRVTIPATPRNGSEAVAALAAGDPVALAKSLFNRLQESAFLVAPESRTVHYRLLAANALAAAVTGSGSAVFAVGRDAADAHRIAAAYRESAPAAADRVFVVRSYP